MTRRERLSRSAAPARRRKTIELRLESLEGRALLASAAGSTTFVAPSIADLAQGAQDGFNTAPATIDRMLTALSKQLTAGPLADLNSGAVDQAGALTEVSTLLTSFNTAVDGALLPTYPNVDRIIKLGSARVQAGLNAVAAETTAGLLTSSQAETASASVINAIGSGPNRPFHATFATIAAQTQAFEAAQASLASSLGTSATTPLTITQVNTVLAAEAAAYRANIDAVVVTRPFVRQSLDTATTNLINQVAAIPSATSTATNQVQFEAATNNFSNAAQAVAQAVGNR